MYSKLQHTHNEEVFPTKHQVLKKLSLSLTAKAENRCYAMDKEPELVVSHCHNQRKTRFLNGQLYAIAVLPK